MPNAAPLARILVIDDEPMIGRAIQRSLLNWDVSISLSGSDALNRLDAGERFDAIVCDIMMPNMTGDVLHAELLRRFPDQAGRMLFVTGGALTAETRAFVTEHSERVLTKPFDMLGLERRIREQAGR